MLLRRPGHGAVCGRWGGCGEMQSFEGGFEPDKHGRQAPAFPEEAEEEDVNEIGGNGEEGSGAEGFHQKIDFVSGIHFEGKGRVGALGKNAHQRARRITFLFYTGS